MAVQMKRPAASGASPAGEPKPKVARQEEGPLVSKCNAIISLLGMAEGYSPETLQVLVAAAKGSLMVSKDSRHAVQHAAIDMVSEVLHSVESRYAEQVAALRGKIAEADAEKAKRDAAAQTAAERKREKDDAVKAATTSLEEASSAVVAAREALTAASAEQKIGDAELLTAGSRKAAGEAFVSNHLASLMDGTAADVSMSLQMLTQVGKDLGVESQLLASAELVLGKAPSVRGAFDSMVAQQLAKQFGTAIAKLSDLVSGGEAGMAERAGKVETCSQRVDEATAHVETCKDKLQAASDELKEAEAQVMVAEKAVEDFGPEMAQAAASAETADAALVACRADLATFAELVEGPQPVPEEPAADEGASAEPAGAADASAAQGVPAEST